MKQKTKQNLLLIIFGVTLLVGLQHLDIVLKYLGKGMNIILPVIIGGVIAFILSVPISAYSNLVTKLSNKLNKPISEKVNNIISMILTFLSLITVLAIVMVIVIPELIESVKIIIEQIKIKWPEWQEILLSYNIHTESITEYFENINIEDYKSQISDVANGITDTVSLTISVGSTILFSIITAFYMLLFKKDLSRQVRKVMYANMKQEKADKVIELAKLLRDTYAKFLTGQCKESAILGIFMLIALSIFRLPYAGLIAILTFVCAFIPYIGAFISCGVGVFLTLLSSPEQAIICLAVYQVVQFIEGQFIYPRVVGGSVGMLPIWTFLSVLIGRKLISIVGILFFIPLTATLHIIISKNTDKKLRDKNITIN